MADPAIVAVRFFTYGLAILLFGSAAFALYAPADGDRPSGAKLRAAPPLLLAVAASVYVLLLAREASGAPQWPGLDLVVAIYAGTGFGAALAVTQASSVALALLSLSAGGLKWPRLILSGLALAALAFVGHAADGAGWLGAVRLAVLTLHLLAIGAWIGALPLLWRALAKARTDPVALLARFGALGGVCVAMVLATGVGALAFMVVGAGGRLGASYTQVLVLKLAFVAGLLCLAAVNRFRLTPMMTRDPAKARTALRRSIIAEQILGLGALAAVALLGQLDPTM
jgi:putative copper resistance protein D